MKLKKGYPLAGWRAFVEACPTCKNKGTTLCKNCKMEIESGYDPKPEFAMTNADRIRAMSDEELADWLARTQTANVAEALAVAMIPYEQQDGLKDEVAKDCLEWLKQPVEVNENA